MVGRFGVFTLAISELSQYWNKIAAEEMKAFDLKAPYAIYLITLYKNPDGITAAGLCEACNKDKAEISRAISLLEKRGLITRDSTASYRAPITLTESGKKAALSIRERINIAVEAGGKGISDSEREIFYKCLEIILANLKKISKEGLPK